LRDNSAALWQPPVLVEQVGEGLVGEFLEIPHAVSGEQVEGSRPQDSIAAEAEKRPPAPTVGRRDTRKAHEDKAGMRVFICLSPKITAV
jgi:hypothetical protein